MKSHFAFSLQSVLMFAVVFAAFVVLMNGSWIGAGAVKAAAPGKPIPDMLFSYPPGELVSMFEALGPEARLAYLTMNSLDFGFAVSYGLFYFVSMGWIALKLAGERTRLWLLGFIGIFGALADEVENVVYRFAAQGGIAQGDPATVIASVSCTVKYLCIYASAVLIAAGLVAMAIKAGRNRKNAAKPL